MTLAKIIDTLKMIALKHPNVNSAYEGNIYDILNSKPDNRYASVVITQQSHTTDEIYDHYGFVIFYVDRLVDDLEENRVQIQSIGKSMLGNIITAFCNEFEAECENISYQPFTQRFADETAGVYCTITIDTVKDVYCAERYWDESWSAPIVSIKNVDMSITIIENGHYVLEYDPTTHTGIGKVDIDVDFNTEPYYNDGYNNGYDNGKNDGYREGYFDGEQVGFGNGYESGTNEQKSKLESINITENGTYTREDGYNSITVEVPDLNGSYDEGYSEGYSAGVEEGVSNAGGVIAETARVLDITENGIYGSQYSDPIYPNVITGDFGDGNYFYDWADLVNEAYFTDAYVTKDSKIEVWWKSKNNYNGDAYYLIVGAGADGNFQIRTNSDGSGFWLEIGGQRVTYAPLIVNEWYHIVLSAEGAYINGEKCGEFSNPYDFGEKQVCINSAPYISSGRLANGTMGMVKVDDHIYIPTQDGFINYHTKQVLEKKLYGGYIFTENKIIMPQGNLIKTVNVNVVPKIDVNECGLKFGYSTFSEVPEWADFDSVTSFSDMFYNCGSLITIPQFDTSNATNMNRMFGSCGSLTSIPQLDTSNVTDMSFMFTNCYRLQTIPQLNTSNVTNMNNMFYSCSSLTTLPQLDVSKVTGIKDYFRFGGSNLTDVGGWKNLKIDWNEKYGLALCPKLTYQSCINILNGLYDFVGNGESTTKTLKVHQNFLDTVGDEISIGTNKGWIITA